jgi:hypothetical protein
MQINGHTLNTVLVVDDDPDARGTYQYAIEDLKLTPVFEEGPLPDVDAALRSLSQKADSLICDYHLRKRNYSAFNGDLFVARSYQARVPGLLCTSYSDFEITLMRTTRRFIPNLVKSDEFGPESIIKAFTRCILENDGQFDPSRKPWRTLVRIEEIPMEVDYCYVVVPAWRTDEKIRLLSKDIPNDLRAQLVEGARFHAQVNLGVARTEELYFTGWEAQ